MILKIDQYLNQLTGSENARFLTPRCFGRGLNGPRYQRIQSPSVGRGGLHKGREGKRHCMAHLGCQVWVGESLGVSMRSQMNTSQNQQREKAFVPVAVPNHCSQVSPTSFAALPGESILLT